MPCGVPVRDKSYFPTRTAIASSLDRFNRRLCQEIVRELRTSFLSSGGAITFDVVTLKIQGSQYYDFTAHNVVIVKPTKVIEGPSFRLRTLNIIFTEAPEVSNTESIRDLIYKNLRETLGRLECHSGSK